MEMIDLLGYIVILGLTVQAFSGLTFLISSLLLVCGGHRQINGLWKVPKV